MLGGTGPRGREPAGIIASPVGVEGIEVVAGSDIGIPKFGGASQ